MFEGMLIKSQESFLTNLYLTFIEGELCVNFAMVMVRDNQSWMLKNVRRVSLAFSDATETVYQTDGEH